MNIEKNNVVPSDFELVTDFDNVRGVNFVLSEKSYYLKGYKPIEKEISLIESRVNTEAFIPKLANLEKRKREILQDKNIERLKLLFLETPINNEKEFMAGKIDYVATNYIAQKSLSKILGTSFLLGLLIGFIYLFFNNLIVSRK